MTTSGPGHRLLTDPVDGAINGGGAAPSRRSKRNRSIWLRWIGALALSASIALLVVPVSFGWSTFFASGRTDCGVPLQALFLTPADACGHRAMFRAAAAATVAGIGVALLAFSGIRRRLRFLGAVVLGASPFLMMFRTSEGRIVDGFQYTCGSAIADLFRRGYREISVGSRTTPLDPWCGDLALNRFFITLGVATVGVLLLSFAALRRYRAGEREPL